MRGCAGSTESSRCSSTGLRSVDLRALYITNTIGRPLRLGSSFGAPQEVPDLVGGDLQGRRQETAIPAPVTIGWRLVELPQQALLGLHSVLGWSPAARFILEPGQTPGGEPRSPCAHRRRSHSLAPSNPRGTLAACRREDNARPKREPLFSLRSAEPALLIALRLRPVAGNAFEVAKAAQRQGDNVNLVASTKFKGLLREHLGCPRVTLQPRDDAEEVQ